MKAQRRHELKTNILAQSIWNFPEFAKKHGPKLLLGAAIIILVFVLIQRSISAKREALAKAREDVALAREIVSRLAMIGTQRLPREASEPLAAERDRFRKEIADRLAGGTDDPQVTAETGVVRGDLNWVLASQPDLPGAATQPSLALPEKRSDLLQAAKREYQQVVENYPNQRFPVAAARLGLAAIAENDQAWDVAKEQYEKIGNDSNTPAIFKDLAQTRLKNLADLQQPVYLAPPATLPSTMPTTLEAVGPTMVATQPSTAPTTVPAP